VANRGNAAIGYGIPGGIGAQLAAGSKPVVAITGDGGLNMSLGDLEFLVRNSVPLTLIVVNNAASGYVKALQHGMYHRYQSSDLSDLNYAEIFKAMGGDSTRVEEPDRLAEALSKAISEKKRPVLIDMVTTRDPGRMLPATDSRTRSKGNDVLKAA
jgi:acetolactate synthase-1/2/3 large subunit